MTELNTAVLYGSVRRDRQGIKAARFVVKKLEERGHRVTLIDAAAVDLPLLDRMHKEFDAGEAPDAMQTVADILDAADGFVLVAGEYNHSIQPGLKNLLDHYQKQYHFKPSALVTYSAGPFAGLRGLVNLRGIMAELGSPTIPTVFPVSKVQNAFDENGDAIEKAYNDRVTGFMDEYEWYARALKAGREQGGSSSG